MASELPPGIERPEFEQTPNEGGLASVVRWLLTGLSFFLLLIPITWFFAVKIVAEYERGVKFRLGRLQGAKGPGLFLVWPIIDRIVVVDLRTVTMDVASQECITRDNVTVKVNAVVYFRVVEPVYSVTKVLDHFRATSQISQTTLRSVIGQSLLDEVLSEREKINMELQKIIDEQTEPWGVKVTVVEVKDVELPVSMQRAMAREAEAERERRAKVINADGELQASERLAEAGRVMSETPATLQLRFLQTLTEVASERNSTIIFPVPIDLLSLVADTLNQSLNGGRDSGGGTNLGRRVRVGPAAPVDGDPAEQMAPPAGTPPPLEPGSHEGVVS